MKRDWAKVAASLRSATNLAADPVAVKMLPEAGELMEYPEVRALNRTAVCHLLALARYYREEGVVGSSSEGMRCLWGSACLGLIHSPERLKDGSLYAAFTSGPASSRSLHRSIGMIGDTGRRYGAMLASPLDLTPTDPDAILMYVTPAQALRLVIAHLHRSGEAVTARVTGQASVCASIARVLRGSAFELDLPCVGDRLYGIVQEQEMVVVISASELDHLLQGIDATQKSASHPYKPFLRWPVVLPSEMEPRRSEI